MHEVHVARSVLDIAVREAEHHAAERIKSIRVVIGRYSCVNPDALSFCFEVVSRGTMAQGAKLEVERAAATGACPRCEAPLELAESSLFCPSCGDLIGETLGVQELGVDSLEVE